MAFLHCDNCNWQQDDFWTHGGYNPLRYLVDAWEDMLFHEDFDGSFSDCASFIEEHGDISRRELLARQCERSAEKIRTMLARTEQEYRDSKDHTCPMCGEPLDID